MKKALWICYVSTSIILIAIILWGLSGVYAGGGITYQILSFYMIIPAVAGFGGIILGIYNARKKRVYPFFVGLAAYIIPAVILREPVWISAVFSFFFPFLAAMAGIEIGLYIWGMQDAGKIKLKKITIAISAIATVIISIHVVRAATIDRIIEYSEIPFHSPYITPCLNGYRVAFITDTHYLPADVMWGIVEELNQRELDLVILGGDYATFAAPMQKTMEILSNIETADGIFGVEGNHDNYRLLFAAMEANGITPLSNSGYHVREGFFLAGVEDLWNRNPDIAMALEGSSPGDFILMVSHNPDVSMQQDTTGIDLFISGHTHGGQISFFGIWAPYFTVTRYLTAYGQRFKAGWALSRDGVPVFVSRGIGSSGVDEFFPRVFARPQVVIFTLYTAY